MDMKKFSTSILKGTILSTLITFLFLLILSIVMMKFELSRDVYNWIYVGISIVSMVIGIVTAVKINEEKGWLVGLLISFIYYIIFFFFAGMFGGGLAITSMFFTKMLLALIVGILAGILGINI